MAEILQTLDQIEDFFANLITEILKVEPDTVQIAFPQEGRPSFTKDQDVIYLYVYPEADERDAYKHRTKVYNDQNETYTYTQHSQRTLILNIMAYGPNCYENCVKISNIMYFENNRITLLQNYLALVPDHTIGPTRLPEQHNGQWWKRCDLKLRFYNAINVEDTVSSFVDVNINVEVNQ